jgi:hypothetical protein
MGTPMTHDIPSLLTGLDAAPAGELTAAERERREDLLHTVLRDSGRHVPSARAPRRRHRSLALAIAGTVAVAGALVVVVQHAVPFSGGPGGPLTTAELAAWTSTPGRLDVSRGRGAAARSWCLDEMKDAPGAGKRATITNGDFRGKVASMIVHRGGNAMLCLTGSDGTGLWELVDPVRAVAPDAVTVDSAGSHGDKDTGFTYVEGSVGSDVREVSVRDAGRSFSATVQDGRWTAWWPTPDPHGTVTGSVVLGLADGTTRTVSSAGLSR